MPETLLDWLAAAGRHPDGGLRFVDRREDVVWVGWSEVRAAARAAALGLRDLGVEPGQRVAIVFPTGPGFFTALFGTLLAGAVPVPLYPPVRLGRFTEYAKRTARMIAGCGAALVLAESRVQRLLAGAVVLARPPLGCRTLEELRLPRGGSAEAPSATDAVGGSALALVQFSSGTTADPRPVALSHRALVAQTEALSAFWPDSVTLRHSCVSWLPLYHDMGLVGCVFPALARDASLTLIAPELFVTRPAIWLRTLARYRATVSAAPSSAYSLATQRIEDSELAGVDLSSWQTALCGAESISPGVARAFCRRFARWGFQERAFTPVYGLSEAALAVTFSDLDRPFRSARFDRGALAGAGRARIAPDGREIVSVGRPVAGFQLQIADAQGKALADGLVGRILIQGPSLMDGYLGDEEATSRTLRDGWLDTGDLGFLLDGELYLTGRGKEVIILHGRNHAPEEIERAVEEGVTGVAAAAAASWHPEDDTAEARTSAASPLSDVATEPATGGRIGAATETLALFVEIERGVQGAERAALARVCREAVLGATRLAVDRVVLLPAGALPRTSSGKVRRGEALRLYLAGELPSLEPEPPAADDSDEDLSGQSLEPLAMAAGERGET
jgi:acyl-CoA synthetase (AMP-forming)/AMP-acid ligase II